MALDDQAIRSLIPSFPRTGVRAPGKPGALIVLTSGSTGRPKGAARRTAGAVKARPPS